MIQIKTVTTTATETEITFDKFNLGGAKDLIYIWVRNLGDNDVYIGDKTGVEAEADDTILIKAGDIGLVTTALDNKIYAVGASKLECHAQLFAECPFKRVVKGGGGAPPVIESLSVDQNGIYTVPTGVDGYSPVTVALPLGTKSITQNGTYTASTDELEGYSSVSVDVQPNLGTKSITQNGTYTASSDSLDGYSSITVEVETGMKVFLVTLTETSSGVWTSDKTFAEVLEAYENDELIIAETDSMQLSTGFALASMISKTSTPQGEIPNIFTFSYESLGDGELYVLEINMYDDGEIYSTFQTFTNY